MSLATDVRQSVSVPFGSTESAVRTVSEQELSDVNAALSQGGELPDSVAATISVMPEAPGSLSLKSQDMHTEFETIKLDADHGMYLDASENVNEDITVDSPEPIKTRDWAETQTIAPSALEGFTTIKSDESSPSQDSQTVVSTSDDQQLKGSSPSGKV